MEASLIWYRARSGGIITDRLTELLDSLGFSISDESATIDPSAVPVLLAKSLKNSAMTVIIGGMDIRRENENIVTILSRCLALRLENGELSRSKYIYDTLRGLVLPTFESAVLFPSANGGPEGMMLAAGEKVILLLPWMELENTDIITMMQCYLPQMMGLTAPMPEPEPEPAIAADSLSESALPDYIERAAAKHRPPPVKPDEELNAAQLKDRLYQERNIIPLGETNRSALISQTDIKQHHAVQQPARQITASARHSGHSSVLRVLIVVLLLAVIGASSYIAVYYYESGLLPDEILYQSELSALFVDNGDSSLLPEYAQPQFAQLYAINPDIRGFISIDGTKISLPIVQSSDGGNDKYSGMDFYGYADARGTLYFDAANDISYGAYNSNLVVYGSSPVDGSMFSQLEYFTDANFLSAHSVIQLDTLYEHSEWLVFSVCIVSQDTVSEFNYANTGFAGQNSHELHLYNLYIRSLFYTETQVFPTDELLTLVADSDEFAGAKLLICARKLREDEDTPSGKTNIIANDLVLMPDVWYEMNNTEAPDVPKLEFTTTRDTITAPVVTDENGNRVYVYESTYTTTTTTTTTTATTTTTTTTAATAATASASGTAATTTSSNATTATTLAPSSSLPDMRITSGGKVITGSASDVLALIIEAEMGSGYNIEALKAQAVAAYTFYLYSGGSAKAPSFPTKTAGSRAKEAAKAVAGQYMTFNGSIPYTPYYAISAGRSANNADINGAKLSYLTSVDCSVDKKVSGYCVVKEVTASSVASKVLSKKGIDLTTISDKSQWFKILERDANDLYVTKVSVGGKTFKGNTLHLSILGYTCLRSPCFTIEYNAQTDKFIFTSYGYGTGVGMSQTGANEYAKQGYDYIWILKHFYTGVGFAVK